MVADTLMFEICESLIKFAYIVAEMYLNYHEKECL